MISCFFEVEAVCCVTSMPAFLRPIILIIITMLMVVTVVGGGDDDLTFGGGGGGLGFLIGFGAVGSVFSHKPNPM